MRLFSGAIARPLPAQIAVLGTMAASRSAPTATLLVQALNGPWHPRQCWSPTARTGDSGGATAALDFAIPFQFCSANGQAAIGSGYETEQPQVMRDRGPGAPTAIRLPSHLHPARSQPSPLVCNMRRNADYRSDFPHRAMPTPQSADHADRAFAPTRRDRHDLNMRHGVAEIPPAIAHLRGRNSHIPVPEPWPCPPAALQM